MGKTKGGLGTEFSMEFQWVLVGVKWQSDGRFSSEQNTDV